MNNPTPNNKASHVRLGDDGEVIGGILPVPKAPAPTFRLSVSGSVHVIVALTVILTACAVLSLLGVIRPSAMLSAITRPLCLSRLGRQRILFLSQRNGDTGLYVMNADGTGPCCLLDDRLSKGYPKPSSDGKSIYFVVDHAGISELDVMKVDGTGIQSLYAVGDRTSEGRSRRLRH